ncbi:MAG: phage major capsid protein [Planctomycetota bacterium]
MWQEIKKLQEQRNQVLADMKAILTTAEDEKRELTDDESSRFDTLNTDAERIKTDVERRERVYAVEQSVDADGRDPRREERSRAGRGDIDGNQPEEQREADDEVERRAIENYLRGSPINEEEQRALTITGMGVVGDRTVYSQLVESMKMFAGVRQAGATVLATDTGNDLDVPTSDDTSNTGQIVGEGVTNNTVADPTMSTVTLGAFKFDSKWIMVSTEMLQDASFPLEQHILMLAGERISRAYNTFATTGTGTGQPKGFLVGGTSGKTAATTSAFTYEEMLDLLHSVDAGYRNNTNAFRWQLHDTTLAAVRKLKDGDGRYIFASGAAGAPSTILDFPYVVNNSMPQLSDGAGSKVLACGDFSRYFCRDVTRPEIRKAEELFIGDGLIGFRVFSRHDGNVTDAASIKYLELAAS